MWWAVGIELDGGGCEEALRSGDVVEVEWGYNAFEGGGAVSDGLH